ncbi:MAG: dynamin family protein [Bacilli bacterium]|nr:dynamin family protein [Bacilli bacterium]
MNVFEKSKESDLKFNNIFIKIDDILSNLKIYCDNIDLSSIEKIKNNFKNKIDDFYREDRKLNIGIIGQVKAGKSSFLNTLIFDGKRVLPTAATPKTATLTKIEYSENNFIDVEYYTKEEWTRLENEAVNTELGGYQIAKEIINMAKKNNIDIKLYLDKKHEKINFKSYENLMDELNDYVGENGKLTPLVKSIKLGVNKKELKEISIVDTPGLNDPIISRTDKTKQFIELCDVVFFLSRASQFLDKSDVQLLTSQLPQKGVKKLVFLCSKYDDGLVDTIFDEDSLEEANRTTKIKLRRIAKNVVEKNIIQLRNKGASEELINVIQDCKNPIFISAMAYNMSKKTIDTFDEFEQKVYENLNYNDDLNFDSLKSIGNIDTVKEIFEKVVNNKEETLIKKANSFIPDVERQIKEELINIKTIIKKRITLLSNNDKEDLIKKKKHIKEQINNISAEVEEIFGNLNIKLEKNKSKVLSELRNVIKEYSSISEKTGIDVKVNSYRVSTSVWYKPSTWGTSRREYSTYEVSYQYLDAGDALENLRNYSNESATLIEETFNKAIDAKIIKQKLLEVVINNFNASNEEYDPNYFKLLATKTLNNIKFPVVKIDITDFINDISSKFSGEIRDMSERSKLKILLSESITKLFDNITSIFLSEINKFELQLNTLKTEFSSGLLENINNEFDSVIKQVCNKEKEISLNKEILDVIDKISL